MSETKSRVAIVTGGGRGIGRAIACKLSQNGYDVLINYAGNAQSAEETKALCEQNQVKAVTMQADVSTVEGVEALFAKAKEEFGQVDVLVNNADITRDGLIIGMKEDAFDDVWKTNVRGAFLCSKSAAKLMLRAKKGRIINISSVVGLHGNAGQSNYSASKAALIGLTKSLAKELGSRHITVNAVAPGFIKTDMTDAMTDEAKAAVMGQIPLGTVGLPEDVANAVAFLASEEASYITGHVLSVDGGMGA